MATKVDFTKSMSIMYQKFVLMSTGTESKAVLVVTPARKCLATAEVSSSSVDRGLANALAAILDSQRDQTSAQLL